ncbi:hypothetical protein AB4144_33005, partial [Rhizobiaceae sp. 2RAB30]
IEVKPHPAFILEGPVDVSRFQPTGGCPGPPWKAQTRPGGSAAAEAVSGVATAVMMSSSTPAGRAPDRRNPNSLPTLAGHATKLVLVGGMTIAPP